MYEKMLEQKDDLSEFAWECYECSKHGYHPMARAIIDPLFKAIALSSD